MIRIRTTIHLVAYHETYYGAFVVACMHRDCDFTAGTFFDRLSASDTVRMVGPDHEQANA